MLRQVINSIIIILWIFLLAPRQKLSTVYIRTEISQQFTDTETMGQSA